MAFRGWTGEAGRRAHPRGEVRPSRVGRRGLLVVVAAVLVVAAGCAGSDSRESAPESVGGAVRGYGTTIVSSGPTRLVRVDEMRAFVFLGFDVREQPVLDPKQFPITTLHGPCGAPLATPFRATPGAFKVFRSTIALVIETLAEPGPEAVGSLIDSVRADDHPGCAPYEEQIGTGGSSQVRLVKMLDLPPVGDDRVGWLQSVTAPDGTVGYRSVILVGNGPRLAMLAVITQKTPDEAQLREVVSTAAAAR
jgi:hypothetical protein